LPVKKRYIDKAEVVDEIIEGSGFRIVEVIVGLLPRSAN
jgi:hypothetical protein